MVSPAPAVATRLHVQEQSDEVLVARAQGGDRAAFRELYLRHARQVAAAVARWLGHNADVDDIVQDTFVRAAERLDSLRSAQHVRPWLVTIAIRLTHSRLVRQRRRGSILRVFGWNEPRSSDPRERAPADELLAALLRQPEGRRLPWMLHRIEGEKLEDVASSCGVSLATIKRRIAECEQALSNELGAWAPAAGAP
ncbi:MAG: RNA polymerase sigma factor [Nannocystaceae bacterium]|nr:RNA polymerase sigma factor [Nannocystaceae bacterium]